MKNNLILIFFFILCLSLTSCKTDKDKQEEIIQVPEFTLSDNLIEINETSSIILSNYANFNDLTINVYPTGIVNIEGNNIYPISTGQVEITIIHSKDSSKKSIQTLTICDQIPEFSDSLSLVNNSLEDFVKIDTFKYYIELDSEYLEYLNSGHLITKKEGSTIIKIVDRTEPNHFKEVNVSISENEKNNEIPEFRLNNNYIFLNSTTALRLTNYSDLSKFDIIFSEEGILEIDSRHQLTPVSTGNVTIYVREKTNHAVYNKFEMEVISIAPKLFITKDKFSVDELVYINISNLFETHEQNLNEFKYELSNDNIVLLDNYTLKGVNVGKTTLTVTSIYNPLVKATYNLEVTNATDKVSIYLKEGYTGLAKRGDQFHLELNGEHKIEDFTLISLDEKILRVTAEGVITIVDEGFVTVTAYETAKPSNKSTFRIYINGVGNIDYVARLLHQAIGEKGYVERWSDEAGAYVNDTKYNHWYNMEGAWCAMFVSWNWYHAGLSNDLLLKYASCSLGMAWCQEMNIFNYKETYTPKSGDIVFFLSSGSSHTGIVVYCDGTYVYTIEGNASNRVDVWRWSVKDARITGYAAPHYPEYNGTPEDFSWITGTMDNGKYWWNNVPEKQPMT